MSDSLIFVSCYVFVEYEIQVLELVGAEVVKTTQTETTFNTLTQAVLTPNTPYIVYVSAKNEKGLGDAVSTKSSTTSTTRVLIFVQLLIFSPKQSNYMFSLRVHL